MEISGVGSGVMLALAAGLWLVYLVPSWLRNREYTATERNAVRLQQTLRVLAETAEMPTAVRAEATARSVAEQEKFARLQERERAARVRLEAVSLRSARVRVPLTPAQRLRRTRAVTSAILLVAAVVLVIQVPSAFMSGITSTGFAVICFTGIALVSGFALLGRLREVGRARSAAAPVYEAPVARRFATSRAPDVAAPITSWTPVPVPKPLYLSRSEAAVPAPSGAAAAASELERAARAAELALRAAAASAASSPAAAAASSSEVTPIRRQTAPAAAAPAATPSRFAAMGRLYDADLGRTDIDEVLRRRRLAG